MMLRLVMMVMMVRMVRMVMMLLIVRMVDLLMSTRELKGTSPASISRTVTVSSQ